MSSLLPYSEARNAVFDGSGEKPPEFHLYKDHNGARKIISSTRLPCFFCVRNVLLSFRSTFDDPVQAYAIFNENGYIDVLGSMATVNVRV